MPFAGDTNDEIIDAIQLGKFHMDYSPFKKVSNLAKDLIRKLLVLDVDLRLSAEEAYNHPFISNLEEAVDSSIAKEAFVSMKEFVGASNFKKTALTFMAQRLPETTVEDLRSLFINIDANGDGRISTEEFVKSMQKCGVLASPEELTKMISYFDMNNNGMVDYTEFLAATLKSKVYLEE